MSCVRPGRESIILPAVGRRVFCGEKLAIFQAPIAELPAHEGRAHPTVFIQATLHITTNMIC